MVRKQQKEGNKVKQKNGKGEEGIRKQMNPDRAVKKTGNLTAK